MSDTIILILNCLQIVASLAFIAVGIRCLFVLYKINHPSREELEKECLLIELEIIREEQDSKKRNFLMKQFESRRALQK